ncbi:DsbE family thiol:disulfide interchange protein [Sphingomonas sp. EC-HK361]|uniref:redoxin family protein n=1 Tax=Sphingomonas sp. EC-HK361 TaxID=2038397 RepID=UPI00125667B5|nr:redoxin family protein [Sphingomonas sp. EC-HK361]VVT02635.1 DsbE family thiol:disulfide interchange protein [Sphingomonas sp. EC-HK361]
MKRWVVWLPLLGAALLFAVVGYALWKPQDRTVRSAMIGKPMPAITLPAAIPGKLGYEPARLASGSPRLVNVFASWCVPCAAESPQLMALKQAGITIDGLAIRDKPADVADFLARYGDPYASIGDDRNARVQLSLGSSGVPESFVVDGKGRIVLQHVGDIRADDVPAIIAAVRDAQ